MTEILAIFRSRSQAIDCAGKLKANNLPAGLINTPREANVGCGLSVKFPYAAFGRARGVIARGNYTAFNGYMKMENKYGRVFITRLK